MLEIHYDNPEGIEGQYHNVSKIFICETLVLRRLDSVFFVPWGLCFEIKISQGRHASSAFKLHQVYEL